MKSSKHQVIFIRGGESFENKKQFYRYLKTRPFDIYKQRRSWRDWLEWGLSERFDSFTPVMPNKDFADYNAWKIWFERLFPFIKKSKKIKIILVGNSLGSLFLLKYLSENRFPKHIDQIHLVCPVIDNSGLIGEYVGNFKLDLRKMGNIERQTDHLSIYHSRDDPLVPFNHSARLMKHFEMARLFEFEDRKHFSQPAFMELLQNIYEQM
jgi:predicted alpha/beta hydrolase family esterase